MLHLVSYSMEQSTKQTREKLGIKVIYLLSMAGNIGIHIVKYYNFCLQNNYNSFQLDYELTIEREWILSMVQLKLVDYFL